MATPQHPPRPLRQLHLAGGLRAVEIGDGSAVLVPLGRGAGQLKFDAGDYEQFGTRVVSMMGLEVYGCEFFRSPDELEGLRPAEWRALPPMQSEGWVSADAEQMWSQLSFAAYGRNEARIFLLSGSLTSQSRFVSMRLLDLSNIYLQNLSAVLKAKKDIDTELMFKGYFYHSLFSSIHAAFFEIATLRDYVAEFIAAVILGRTEIDSMQRLFEYIGKHGAKSPIENEVIAMCSKGGWLWQFSELRNTVAHRMPFNKLPGSGGMHLLRHNAPTGHVAHLFHIPVPSHISKNYKYSHVIPDDKAAYAKILLDEEHAGVRNEDTLHYLNSVARRIFAFSGTLRTYFPFAPEMMYITDTDIIKSD